MSERSDVKFQSTAPTRCPYCHDVVDRTSDAWVACEGCLARHHAACWSETGACGACHETACVVPAGVALEPAKARPASSRGAQAAKKEPEPALEPDVAVYELAVQGDPPVWLASEPGLAVLARAPDSVEQLAVRVRNGTDRPQQIEVRTAPSWMARVGEGMTAAPGETVTLRLDARVADAPMESSDDDQRAIPGLPFGCGFRFSTSITLRFGELVRTVPVDVVRPFSDVTIKRWFWFLSFLLVAPFVYVNARSLAKPVTLGPAESHASWLLRRRAAEESARQAAIGEQVLIRWLALVVATLLLVVATW